MKKTWHQPFQKEYRKIYLCDILIFIKNYMWLSIYLAARTCNSNRSNTTSNDTNKYSSCINVDTYHYNYNICYSSNIDNYRKNSYISQ